MVKKKKQRISYCIPLAGQPGGHKLGINGLAIDHARDILYTGGRDGVICAWNLDHNTDARRVEGSTKLRKTTASFKREVQAHTDWVNDLVQVKNDLALVSASNDTSVKLWRPHSHDTHTAYSIGSHNDYVNCLAAPHPNSDWIASAGLDYRVCLWDLAGKGQKLDINIKKLENPKKASVYALEAKGSVIASSGPDGVVRLWDVNSGKSISKLVGHTDLVRDILMSDDGETLLSASSDQTIKVWSVKEGRCVSTLTMHDDSVWCLYSNDPGLSIFYSGDRSGRVAKTDLRYAEDIEDAVSVAVCQENYGIRRLTLAGDSIWVATQSSSLNRWLDVDTELEIEEPPAAPNRARASSTLSRDTAPKRPVAVIQEDDESEKSSDEPLKQIPYRSVLRVTNTSFIPGRNFTRLPNASGVNLRKASEALLVDDLPVHSIRHHPEETIDGQTGLKEHVILNDKKRVLTSDTAGDIVLWDLLKCVPIRKFRGKHMDEVREEIDTDEAVANWCTVDTKTGSLTVMLEELYCFDAEVYADQTEFAGKLDFRDDQRINLGKWVLRNLFATLLDEEIRRDEVYRRSIQKSPLRGNAPTRLNIPPEINSGNVTPTDMTTPKANGVLKAPPTPGIGVATPLPQLQRPPSALLTSSLPATTEEATEGEESLPRTSTNSSTDQSTDYFSQSRQADQATPEMTNKTVSPQTPGGTLMNALTQSPVTDEKKKKGLFGKGFNMKMAFPKVKTSGESSKAAETNKLDEKNNEEQRSEQSEKSEQEAARIIEDNFYGVIQKIRYDYADHENNDETRDQPLVVGITPPPLSEAPPIKPPAHTLVLIKEDDPDAGGLRDIYRGDIASLGNPDQTDILERLAPMWLGELLLRNEIPLKDTVKVPFVLTPYQNLLPSIASIDNNARLNANRMLRTKKILGYISERIEAPSDPDNAKAGDELKPEKYMELICNDQVVDPNMTLATLRTHVWRTGGDIILYYRANGRKEMRRAHPSDVVGREHGAVGNAVPGASGTTAQAGTSTTAA